MIKCIATFPMGIMEGHFFSAGKPSLLVPFHCLMVEDHQKGVVYYYFIMAK